MTKIKWLMVVLIFVCVAGTTSQTKAPQKKPAPGRARAARSFTIVTKPFLAFKDGSSVYKLGQPISAFLASFGSAEKIESEELSGGEYKTHYYGDKGVLIMEDKGGAIFKIECYLVASESHVVGAILPANCRTEEGITSESSMGDVTERYGAPFEKKVWDWPGTRSFPNGLHILELYYKFGDDMLCFSFKLSGGLESIRLFKSAKKND